MLSEMYDSEFGDEEDLQVVPAELTRRSIFRRLAALGIGTVVFQKAIAARAAAVDEITGEMMKDAQWISDLELTDAEQAEVAQTVTETLRSQRSIRAIPLDADVGPATVFQPDRFISLNNAMTLPSGAGQVGWVLGKETEIDISSDEELAFASVTQLAQLLREKKISSLELTDFYLERLERFDPLLECVVTMTPDLARKQAKQADQMLREGKDLGVLHGIPWGAKDLIAVPGYPTTWGAEPYRDQYREAEATVSLRLRDAGAVLVAKLTLGALAWGDRWFGGLTKNPWNPKEGSSGSSAGPASAVAAGLCGFAIGSETLGSIVSPCRRCSVTGLRPTFGRVSRFGCMPLAWSMDKIGPIARTVEDCMHILNIIQGPDGLDPTVSSRPLFWPIKGNIKDLTLGVVEEGLGEAEKEAVSRWRDMGVRTVPIELPTRFPLNAMTSILDVESATVFDDLLRSGKAESTGPWPPVFRQGQFVPAVHYIRSNRLRTQLIAELEETLAKVDCIIGGNDLVMTNLTGHPSLVVAVGSREARGGWRPYTIKLTGRFYGESAMVWLGDALQKSWIPDPKFPPIEQFLAEKNEEPEPNDSEEKEPPF